MAYLMVVDDDAEFAAAVQSYATSAADVLRVTGPWPPYNFVSLTLDDGRGSQSA